MKLDKLVNALGFNVKDYPTMFTECFLPATKDEEIRLSKVAGGLSGMLKRLMPKALDGFTAKTLRDFLWQAEKGKIQGGAMCRDMPTTMAEGFSRAIAFQIIRFNDSIPQKYPQLFMIREAIEASSKLCKVAAKGAHKGPHTEAVQDAVKDSLQSSMQMRNHFFYKLLEYTVGKMIADQDPKAKRLLESMYPKQEALQLTQ